MFHYWLLGIISNLYYYNVFEMDQKMLIKITNIMFFKTKIIGQGIYRVVLTLLT